MNLKNILFLTVLTCNTSLAQITINHNFNLDLSEDSLTAVKLETSLNAFLTEAQNNTYSHEYVDSLHLEQNAFFFRKLSNIGENSSATFNSPNVLKSFTADKENYTITVAFTGVKNDIPFVYQITELLAIPYQDHYRFYSPFTENTKDLKTKTYKNVTYHYSGKINEDKAQAFAQFKDQLSELTNTPKSTLNYYCFQSLDELLKSHGFLYSARQCNFLCYDLGFMDHNGQNYLTGTANENYAFGYVGDYLYYNVPNKENMYWPFVQGVSTYYGGYGLSYDSMDDLKKQFRAELQKNPDINFLEEFKKGRKSSVNRHFSYYVLSAFLCEEVMKEKGFDEVLTLVYSGENGDQFFDHLKTVLHVDESNFHQTILRLIDA
jgi:hypothetical protein